MSLKGNLNDFNLTNILQMISLEKKTGSLFISRDAKELSIHFLNGKVVSADRSIKEDELRIKGFLIKNKHIDSSTWRLAADERRKTLKPILQILKKYVSFDVLNSFSRIQVKDCVFELLRWNRGKYEFIHQEIKLDHEIQSLFDVEFLLMEGCRVADEIDNINKNLPDKKSLLMKNIINFNKSPYIDMDKTQRIDLEFKVLADKGIKLEEKEKKFFLIIDDYTSIEEIVNSSLVEEFETVKIIEKFLNLKVLKKIKEKEIKRNEKKTEFTIRFYRIQDNFIKCGKIVILLILTVWSIIRIYNNFLSGMSLKNKIFIQKKTDFEKTELTILSNSIVNYYYLKGNYPASMEQIVNVGLLSSNYLVDSYRVKFKYILKTGLQFIEDP